MAQNIYYPMVITQWLHHLHYNKQRGAASYKLHNFKKRDIMQMPTYNELIFALEILTIPFIAAIVHYLLTFKKRDTNGSNPL
jgi:hypothetical protein